MPVKNSRRGMVKNFLPLFAIVALVWLIPSAAKNGLRRYLSSVQAPIHAAVGWMDVAKRAMVVATTSKKNLLMACEGLMAENAFLRLSLAAASDGNCPTADGDVPEKLGDFTPLMGRVIRRDLAHWTDELSIDIGSQRGIAVGMGVIAGNRVVGRIKAVDGKMATVELITSPRFKMVVHAAGDGQRSPIIFSGDGRSAMDRAMGMATNVPTDLVQGETPPTLVTSELSGVFPENITVGTVDLPARLEGNYAVATVRLDDKFLSTVREVAVLVNGGE